MKSIKYWLVSLFLLFCTKGFSCGYASYSPGEYYMFYVYDDTEINSSVSLNKINIEEWRKLIKNKATIEDIREVVYKYSISDMEKIATLKLNKGDSLYKNSFVRYLQQNNDKEIIDFLLLAKRCEVARFKRADKWWYPTKEDLNNYDLQSILDEALAYKGARLKNRYLLQAVRAAYTMESYDLCLNLWHEQIKQLPQSAVKTMCMGYIGGIEFRKGNYQEAIHFYNEGNDQDSFWWCANYLTKENSDVERIKILYQYQPSSEELAVLIQNICRKAEEYANPQIFNNWDYYTDSYREHRKRYMELRDFALQVATEKRSIHPAMWQYTAAFLTFLDGKAELALQYAEKAATLDGTPFIKEKIKVFQILLEAYAEKKYDTAFETRFLPKLQWLDSLIVRDINVKNREDYWVFKNGKWVELHNASIKEVYNDWRTKSNYSQYYPFDMMRKIVLSVMLPKYEKQKDYTKGLLLAGMASERLRSLSNFQRIDTSYNEKYHTDFSTDIFNYMDEFPVESVIEYHQLLQSGGRDKFEQFLIARCYKNNDYLNELIGTKYMRLEKFEEAISYLSKVSHTYIKDMNVYEFFHLDPFREVFEYRKLQKPYPAYKLNFAKKMLELQQKIETEQNKEKKAAAIWQYAIALERSVSCWQSWALTAYYMGDSGYDYDEYYNDWQKNLLKRSEKLIAKAGKTMENSKNAAVQAKYDWYKNVRYSYHALANETYRNFAENFNDIAVLKPFLSECDAFQSYFIPQYINEKWAYSLIEN